MATEVPRELLLRESSYDPSLSYEERRRLRKLKKETKHVQNNSSHNGSSSSSISSYRSSSSPSPTPSSNYLPSTQKHLQNGSTNGRAEESDKIRFHSTSPETNTSSSSSATPAQISLVDSRVHPMSRPHSGNIVKARTNSDSTLLDNYKQPPPALSWAGISRSNTAQSCSPPQSPHSPVVVGMATRHLTGIIGRQQERERSCSPSLETTSKSRNDVFLFENTRKAVNSESYAASDQTKHPLNQNLSNGASIYNTDTNNGKADLTTIKSTSVKTNSKIPVDLFEGEVIDGGKLSRQSTLSSSSSFTFDSFDQLTSPPPPLKSFASGLKFIDTDFQPDEPEPAVIRGPMQKTNVIYGSHDDNNDTVITRIQGSGFFDASQTQSQADFIDGPNPTVYRHKEETGSMEKILETQSHEKIKAKDKKSRNSKSPLRHMKRNVSDKIIEEDENELDGKSGKTSGKNSIKNKKLKDHKGSINSSSAPNLPSKDTNGEFSPEHKSVKSEKRLFGSARKPPIPTSKSKQKKVSQSFRDDLRGKSVSPDSGGLSKLSMPNLAVSSSPSNLSREGTPESGGSESGGVGKKRKLSLAQRIKSLMGGSSSKEDNTVKANVDNSVVLKTYKKIDVGLPESPTSDRKLDTTNSLGQLPSEPDAAALSSSHRTYSWDCISPVSERSVAKPDSVTSGGAVTGTSSDRSDCQTESGSLTENSSILSRSGDFVGVSDESKVIGSDIDCTLSSSSVEPAFSSKSAVSLGSKGRGSRNSASNKTASSVVNKSSRTSIASPKSSKKTSSTSSGNFSPKSSPRSSKRISTGTSKFSPISTPKASPIVSSTSPRKGGSDSASVARKTSGVSRIAPPLGTKKTSSTASPLRASSSGSSLERSSSPRTSQRSIKSTQSPISGRKAVKKSVTTQPPINSPKAVKKSVTTQAPIDSPKAVKKSVTHSPVGKPKTVKTSIQIHVSKQSPVGSPKTTKAYGMHASLSSPKASPLLTRRVSPSKPSTNSTSSLSPSKAGSSPPKGSPRSSTRKAAPPRLGRVSLDTSKDPGTPNSPNFSRFSKGRLPVKLKSPDQSKVSSPVPKHAPIKITASLGPPPDKLVINSKSSFKKRRIGVSSSESPLPSPLLGPQMLAGADVPPESSKIGMEMNVDSLLASVEQKLSTIVTSGGDDTARKEPDTENPIPAEFKSGSAVFSFSQQSSLDIENGDSREGSPSPDTFLSPEPSQSGVVYSLRRDIPNYPLTVSVSETITSETKKNVDVSKKTTKKPLQSSNQKTSPSLSRSKLNSTSESVLSNSFTVSRPPRPPSTKKISEPNFASATRASFRKPPISSTGVSRPKNIVVANSRKNSSAPSQPTVEKKEYKKSQSSSDLKKTSVGMSPSRVSTLNRSTRTRKSSRVRPGSASTMLHRTSAPSVQQNSGGTLSHPLAGQSSNRKSMRRVSSGDLLAKKIRPGSSATLNKDRRGSAVAVTIGTGNSGNVFSSMRRPKSSSVLRPSVGTESGITRSSTTMSMRLPRNSVGQRGGTLRKSHKGTPPSTVSVAEASLSSPSRSSTLKRVSSSGTMKKNSTGEIFSAFDQISSQASVLTSSDHRRAVRPKTRQKASTSHLKMLRQRQDVTSEIIARDDDSPKVDPNEYATYMGKKNLAPSAMAGLAARVDFSTVQLRKTGTFGGVSDQAGSSVDNMSASPNPATGMEYNTTHPVMLLQIKGRRNIQTRLVEPTPSSLNSGDVFLLLTKDKLFHWVGKSSNIIEKARGSDVVMRIIHKKELSCKATSATVFIEEERSNQNTKKENDFWELLGGKKGVKSSESTPGDEIYEKAVNLATTVYLLEGDKDTAKFSPIHESTVKMVTVSLLQTKNILLFDFYSEMYVWIGNQSRAAMRKKAMELAKKKFDATCKHPAFNLRSSPARASGRYRPRSSIRSPRQSVVNSSGRRSSRVSLSDTKPRPDWALFGRMTEGSEHILFREKFCDWPEQGRIIKMKGHVSSGDSQSQPIRQIELQPADVSKMLKDSPPFEGLRLEGDNIYRGQGNYKISKSSFSCNRVRTILVSKWVIKEFDNVIVPSQNLSIFYTDEAYVVRWGFQITVVRALEGLAPGQGMFAKDRAHQKKLKEEKEGKQQPTPPVRKSAAPGDELDSDSSDEEDEEEKRMLESGGRDRCAYFFWQGDKCTVNEKGSSALMTMELDKERGPQVRVSQGKEPPAFLNLFQGGMILLKGRSENDSLQSKKQSIRVFCVRIQMKDEACLVEITSSDEKKNVGAHLRSRGCFIIYHVKKNRLFLWYGSKSTKVLRKSGLVSAKILRNRLNGTELVRVNEGEEPKDLSNLLGNKDNYVSLANDTRFPQYTPRLFELNSIIGEFIATEVVFPARNGEVEAFTFEQNDLYSAVQPAIFLVDGFYEIYIWLGWWPDQKNKLLKEANATTGSSHAKWLRDKKLALETVQSYVKACNRIRTPRAHVVMAGTEHERFKNLFPFWEDSKTVQELNCKGKPIPKRLDVEDELLKYSRTKFTLHELKQKPPPEGVDPSKLEVYLSDEDFNKIFKMDKSEFSKMPLWKQSSLKKGAGLF